MNELTIAKEAVLKAAKTHPHTRDVLETLFPQAFQDYKHLRLISPINPKTPALFTAEIAKKIGIDQEDIQICQEADDNYAGKAFYLSNRLNWELKPAQNIPGMILIPTKVKSCK